MVMPSRMTADGGAFYAAATLIAGTCFLIGVLLQRQFDVAGQIGTPGDKLWPALVGPAKDTSPHRRVVVFYHIYVASIWEDIVRDQASKLVFSGIYRKAVAINVGIGAPEQQDVDIASDYIRKYGAKFKVIATEANGPSYERLTLHNIRNYTQPGDRILYLHSKGVSRHVSAPHETLNVRLWRFAMEYYLVARWRGCLMLLESYDAVGANYWPPGSFPVDGGIETYGPHFSGNFWWTTYEHWVSLPEQARYRALGVKVGVKYLDPEMFLLSKNDTRIANLWLPEPRQTLYGVSHYPAEYVDLEDLKLTVLPMER